jgi:hypothetical protein
MVDIFKELDGVRDPGPGAERKRRPKPLTLIASAAAVVIIAAAVVVVFIRQNQTPIGRELSSVPGVSIVRRGMLHGGRIANNQINDSGDCKIYRDGYELTYALCDVLDQKLPLIVKTPLPKGKYRVSVLTDHGGREMLLRKLMLAYSEAFAVSISTETVETEVYVMNCPDPPALSLDQTGNMSETFDGDFVDKNSSGSKNVLYKCRFIAKPENLADYTGYMIRKTWQGQDPQVRPVVLATAVVDETGLKGYYGGLLTWKFYDPVGLISELTKKGLKFTRDKRTIKAIVIKEAVSENAPDKAVRN